MLEFQGVSVVLDSRATKAPLVSVVVPSYNTAKFLPETLDSVAKQTFEAFEIILIDDASTDGSIDAALEWLRGRPLPILAIASRVNRGLVATLACALEFVRTPLVSMVASDDLLEPLKLEFQVPMLLEASVGVGFVYSDAYLISENGQRLDEMWLSRFGGSQVPDRQALFESLLTGRWHIPAMTYLIRTEVLRRAGAFSPGLGYEDLDLNLRLAHSAEGLFSGYPSASYRLRDAGLRTAIEGQTAEQSNLQAFRVWIDRPTATRKKARLRFIFAAYWLYEHKIIRPWELARLVWEAPSVGSMLLALAAFLGVPRKLVMQLSTNVRRASSLVGAHQSSGNKYYDVLKQAASK